MLPSWPLDFVAFETLLATLFQQRLASNLATYSGHQGKGETLNVSPFLTLTLTLTLITLSSVHGNSLQDILSCNDIPCTLLRVICPRLFCQQCRGLSPGCSEFMWLSQYSHSETFFGLAFFEALESAVYNSKSNSQ